MDTSSIAIFSAMADRMRHLQAKQQVLATNIANADTPGYQAMRVKDRDFADVLAAVAPDAAGNGIAKPQVDLPRGLGRLGGSQLDNYGVERDTDTSEIKPNGNNVVLEDQLLQIADVQMQYQLMTNLMRKQTGLLRTALGKGR